MNTTANFESLLEYLLKEAMVPNVSFRPWIKHDESISFHHLDAVSYDDILEKRFEEESQLLNERSFTDHKPRLLFIDHKIKVLQEEIKAESLIKIRNPFLEEFIRILKISQEEDRRMALMYFSIYITEKNLSFTDFWRVMAISYNHFPDHFSAFTTLAAQHLKDGYVLEVMLGKSDRVLENWVRQIFYQIKSYLNNAPFTVISVFGPQSTGKSTLLNNLFGTSFKVSNNTCTRGINLRIIPRRDGEKQEFLLLIDVEGIKSTEQKKITSFADNSLKKMSNYNDYRIACLSIIPSDISIMLINGEQTNYLRDVIPLLLSKGSGSQVLNNLHFVFAIPGISRDSIESQQKLSEDLMNMLAKRIKEFDSDENKGLKENKYSHYLRMQNVHFIGSNINNSKHISRDYIHEISALKKSIFNSQNPRPNRKQDNGLQDYIDRSFSVLSLINISGKDLTYSDFIQKRRNDQALNILNRSHLMLANAFDIARSKAIVKVANNF